MKVAVLIFQEFRFRTAFINVIKPAAVIYVTLYPAVSTKTIRALHCLKVFSFD